MNVMDVKKAVIAAVESVTIPEDYVCVSYSVTRFKNFEEIAVCFNVDEAATLEKYTFYFGSCLESNYNNESTEYMSNGELFNKLSERFLELGVTL